MCGFAHTHYDIDNYIERRILQSRMKIMCDYVFVFNVDFVGVLLKNKILYK